MATKIDDLSRYWSTEYHHKYPWHIVASAYWKRYPNPHSKHVFSEDMIDIQVDKTTGVIKTKRIIMKSNKLPWWGKHLFSARRVPVIEEAIIDSSGKRMTTYTRNIGLRFFMGTTERVTYSSVQDATKCDNNCIENLSSQDDTTDSRTNVKKEVWIESDCLGLRSAIKKFGIDRYKRNFATAAEGFEYVLKNQISNFQVNKGHTINTNIKDSAISNNSSGSGVANTINLKSCPNMLS